MWAVLRGILIGLWFFGFGTILFLYLAIYRHLPADAAVGVSAITGSTTSNPLWWTALVICLVLGTMITRSWTIPAAVWIVLLVTGLIPAGTLALFIAILAKLKQASQGHV